ncbi:hypothetical protein Tco_1020703 [Tanacetum coccineum]
MHESKSFNKHPAKKTLYHALMESLIADENAMDQGVADLIKHKKIPHDDDRDQDPPAGPDQGLKKRKTSKDAKPPKNLKSTSPSKSNTSSQPKSTGKSVDNEPAQNWLNDLANAKNPPLTFDYLMITPIYFSAFAMNHLKISKLTKADLVGPNNPKGNCCPYDLNKPLPLHESQGRLIFPTNFFFNNDLEYLRGGSTDRKYTPSITKTKATKVSKHDVYSTMRILSVTNVTVDEWYGYGHLKEIVVRRADKKLYKFMEVTRRSSISPSQGTRDVVLFLQRRYLPLLRISRSDLRDKAKRKRLAV